MHRYWFVFLALLGACSSSPEQAPQVEKPLVQVSPQFSPHAPEAEDVLFANLVSIDGQWQILSIGSQRKPVDLLKGEERLYIRTDKKIVMPDYAHHHYRDEDKRLFDCSQAVSYNRHTSYNPCTSQFTHNTKFGEGWFGWTKRLDVSAISVAIKQSDLVGRANKEISLVRQERTRCLDLKKQAEQLAAKQKLQLRVIDETGMYKNGHELVKYDLKIKPKVAPEGCEQELDMVKLSYDVGIAQNFNLVLEMRGKSDWQHDENKLILERAVAEANKQLVPTLYITAKKVEHYNLYKGWGNRDIELTWRTIDITNTDLRQVFDIHNKSQKEIEVESVTFFINKHVINHRNQHVLPPLKSEKALEHASRYFVLNKNDRQNVEAITKIDSGDEKAEFGVRVIYKIGQEKKTLRMSEKLQLTSIL